ncbi:unnamed protein product [Bursaphelenchus xylophilus]|uniref:(pine wood nematode) hypothetical protein n=1 Tax=Bursaphelenchus xylophilus TaxID=6326 RepID=A0A1I7SMK7_BURXY|nr:unnamed protein product [Bursaphelenchus xylophilus]CAG9130266.1 unnamed protein product [Bursaphelenchus xylophilus]
MGCWEENWSLDQPQSLQVLFELRMFSFDFPRPIMSTLRLIPLLLTAWILTNEKIKIVLSQPLPSAVASGTPQTITEESSTRVIPLIEGMMYPTEKGYVMVSSVTLVLDQGYAIVVDSPSASDKQTTELMLKALSNLGISPSQVHVALTTHGHPDHFGQQNLFSNARHLFGPYDYISSVFNRNELFTKNEMRLTTNVEVWNTPGHTNQDVSVIVREVPSLGVVGVVGDLFYSELDALSSGEDWSRDAWNAALGLENRKRVLCTCDVIVPGHSRIFKVTQEMRSRVGCSAGVPSGQIRSKSAPNPLVPTQIPGQIPQIPSSQTSIVEPSQYPLGQLPPISSQLPQFLPGQPIQNDKFSEGNVLSQTIRFREPELEQMEGIQPSVISLPKEALIQKDWSRTSQEPAPISETSELNKAVLLPVLESAATHLANYLTAAQPGGPVPIPQHTATEVRTYPYHVKMT